MRTARSMTSGEYFGDFLIMAPSSQTKEPPHFPGRFTGAHFTNLRLISELAACAPKVAAHNQNDERDSPLHTTEYGDNRASVAPNLDAFACILDALQLAV
jgi:hypothetical protein